MVNIRDSYLFRGADEIGKIMDNGIYDHTGKRLGYFRGNYVYDNLDRELAWLEGDRIKFPRDGHTLRLEEVTEKIVGGPYSDLARIAVKILLGD